MTSKGKIISRVLFSSCFEAIQKLFTELIDIEFVEVLHDYCAIYLMNIVRHSIKSCDFFNELLDSMSALECNNYSFLEFINYNDHSSCYAIFSLPDMMS